MGHLTAVCDIDSERAKQFAARYQVKPYVSLDDLLRHEQLDGVTVCTPASTHLPVATKTLAAGVNTLVEKPMTSTLKEGEELIRAAEASGKILTVGFIERFNPAITELKKIVEGGSLGKPILFEYRRENRRGENITDVGVVKDASVHDIDTARWLFSEEPLTVYARVGSVMGKNEDFATILLGFSGERTAFITTNWVTPMRIRELTAVFTGGVVTLDFITQEMQIHEESRTVVPKHTVLEPLTLELKEFVSAIEQKRQPLVTPRDGLSAIRIAEAALASSKSGAPIYLSR